VIALPADEAVKPVPIRHGDGFAGRFAFRLRSLVDLQLLTCLRFLSPRLAGMQGRVLDVGCGEMPFRRLLPRVALYTGIDVPAAGAFGMRDHADVASFDGRHVPFPDASFDHVLCTEVLEHAEDPVGLIAEMRRVLRPGGTIAVTVPFAARVHHAPHDYHRFTRFRLEQMFAGFADVRVQERGDEFAVIANKLIVVCLRFARPGRPAAWPLLLLALPPAALALALAHVSLVLGWGSSADPLGYGVAARKE
jgi:SAM-dependent methyltransferase